MLTLAKVNDIVSKAAAAGLGDAVRIQSVNSEPTVDSDGKEALDITIVLKLSPAGQISGVNALDALVRIERALRKAKEERFPIISYATEEELEAASGDTES